ncbi:hypothetical protein [Actinopolymorpha alba]|uniref:hypothetical protein n=1 Tax=Actinopolymorpha alba TaxID=533267 RepID=UPI000477EAF4|nr:hypothetical protein [Actinopolymorpha alba]
MSRTSGPLGTRVVPLALLLLGLLLVGAAVPVPARPAQAVGLPCDGPNRNPPAATPHKPDNGYNRTAADRNKPITPDEAIARGRDWIDARLNYCQSGGYPDRHGTHYRTDCSGFVTMAWHSDPPGYTAWTSMYAIAHPISWSELQPGDAVHNSGHIELVEKVTPTEVRTLGFGHTPPEEEVYSWPALMMAYDEPIRYNKMQVVSDQMVLDWLKTHVQRPVANIQPTNGRTLVNLDTIFWADDAPYHQVVTLPQAPTVQVEIWASPTKFEWDFGDGRPNSKRTTPDGGKPYPNQTITHKYVSTTPPDQPLKPKVDVTWGDIHWQIVGQGPRHDVNTTFTLNGQGRPLRALELRDLLGNSN